MDNKTGHSRAQKTRKNRNLQPQAIAITRHARREKIQEVFSALFLLALFAVFLMSLTGCGMDSNATGGSGSSLGGTSQNVISGLQVGQAQILNFSNGLAQIDFKDNSPAQHYILAVSGGLSGSQLNVQKGPMQTARFNPFKNSKYGKKTKDQPHASFFANPGDAGDDVHAWFREQERDLQSNTTTSSSASQTSFGTGGGPLTASTSGGTTFKVLRNTQSAFVNITATSIGSAQHVEVFWDNNNQPVGANDQQILVTKLNEMALSLVDMLGAVGSDIDSNGKVKVVLTKELNSFSGGALTGYFNAADLSASRPESNGGEVIFLLAPDTSSYYGGSIPPAAYLSRVVPGVFIHELQHLYNYLFKGGQEDASKNEAISHALENYGKYAHELRYKQKECLEKITEAKLENVTDIKTRGCAGLFIQHLCEQSGDEKGCYANIIKSPNSGWRAISQDTGTDLGEHLAKYMAALIVSGSNLTTGAATTAASTYNFKPLSDGPAGDKVGFVPYLNNYGDWRKTKVNGVTVDKTGVQSKTLSGFAYFVEITSAEDFSLQFNGSTLSPFAFGGSGVLIRVSDQGASSLTGNQ